MSKKLATLYLLVPLLVIAVLTSDVYARVSVNSSGDVSRTSVLSKEDDDDENNSGRGNSHDNDDEDEDENKNEEKFRARVEAQERNEEKKELRIEVKEGKPSAKIFEDDEDEEDAEELEVEIEEEIEIEDEIEDNDEEHFKVKVKRGSKFVLEENRVEVSTDFPLTIDLATNELIVTTPAGQKRVTVLPSVAIANMLRSGKFSGINAPEPSASPTPTGSPEGTPSASESPSPTATGEASPSPTATSEATPTAEPTETVEGVELTLNDNNELVYEVDGYKNESLLGMFKVKIKKKAILSAETGELLQVQQSLGSRLLDLLSVE